MKNKHKLSAIAVLLICITMSTNIIAQTRIGNYIPKWNATGNYYENVSTIFYDDVTNSRIGIGTTSPSNTLTVSGNTPVARRLSANDTIN